MMELNAMKQRHTEKVTCRFLHNPTWICFYWGGLVVVVVVVVVVVFFAVKIKVAFGVVECSISLFRCCARGYIGYIYMFMYIHTLLMHNSFSKSECNETNLCSISLVVLVNPFGKHVNYVLFSNPEKEPWVSLICS